MARSQRLNILYDVDYADQGTRQLLAEDRKVRAALAQTTATLKQRDLAQRGSVASSRTAAAADRAQVASGRAVAATQRSTTQATASATTATRGQTTATHSLAGAQRSAAGVSRAVAGADRAQASASRGLAGAIRSRLAALRGLVTGAREAAAAQRSEAAAARSSEAAHRGFGVAASRTSRSYDQISRSASQAERAQRRATATARAQARGGVQRGVSTLGFVGAFGVAGAVRQTVEFDRAMRNVNSIAGLSEKQFKRLSDQVKALGGPTAQQPRVLAEGLYDVVSSGFKAGDAMKILAAGAKAATAGLTTTDVSTKAVTAVLNAYHRPASDARKVSDDLFQTVKLGVLRFDDLASGIGDVLPFASSLGVNLKGVGAAITTLTKAGISPEETMTRIKNVMVTMFKPGNDLKKVYKELGVAGGQELVQKMGGGTVGFQRSLEAIVNTSLKAGDLKKAYKSLGVEGFDELKKKTGGTSQANKALAQELSASGAEVAKLFPNIRSLGGALALTGRNTRGAEQDLKGFANTTGVTEKTFREQSKSTAVQWDKFKAIAAGIGITIGTKILPVINTLLIGVVKFGRHHGTLLKIAGAFVAIAAGIKLIRFTSALLGITDLIKGARTATRVLAGLRSGATLRESVSGARAGAPVAVGPLGRARGRVGASRLPRWLQTPAARRAATPAAAAAPMGGSFPFFGGPSGTKPPGAVPAAGRIARVGSRLVRGAGPAALIGGTAAAVGGAAIGGKTGDAISGIGGMAATGAALGLVGGPIGAAIGGALGAGVGVAMNKPLREGIGKALASAGKTMASWASSAGKWFAGIGSAIGGAFAGAGNAVADAVSAAFGGVKAAISAYVGVWTTIFRTWFNVAKTVVGTGIRVVSTVFRTGFGAVRAVLTGYVRVWATIFRTGFNVLRSVVTGAVRGVIAAWGAISAGLRAVGRTAVRGAGAALGALGSVGRAVIGRAVKIVRGAWDIVSALTAPARRAVSAVLGALGGLIGGAAGVARKVVSGIVGAFRGIGSKIGNVLSSVAGVVKGVFNGVIGVINRAIGAINSATPGKISLPGPLPDIPGIPDIPMIPTLRRGGMAASAASSGLVDVLVSPGEVGVMPGGRAFRVPGARTAADSVYMQLPERTAILTGHGQALVAGGASVDEALSYQRPHFRAGGIVRPAERFQAGGEVGKATKVATGLRAAGERGNRLLVLTATSGRESRWSNVRGAQNSNGTFDWGPLQINDIWKRDRVISRLWSRRLTYEGNTLMAHRVAQVQGPSAWRLPGWRLDSTVSPFANTAKAAIARSTGGTGDGGGAEKGRTRLSFGARPPSRVRSFAAGYQAGLEGTRLWDTETVRQAVQASTAKFTHSGGGGGGRGGAASGQRDVERIQKWGDAVVARGYPYTYGGGHGALGKASGSPTGFDCSGLVSGALGAAGLIGAPMATDGLKSWGVSGDGRFITVGVRGTTGHSAHTMIKAGNAYYESGGSGGGPHKRSSWDGSFPIRRHPAREGRGRPGVTGAGGGGGGGSTGGGSTPTSAPPIIVPHPQLPHTGSGPPRRRRFGGVVFRRGGEVPARGRRLSRAAARLVRAIPIFSRAPVETIERAASPQSPTFVGWGLRAGGVVTTGRPVALATQPRSLEALIPVGPKRFRDGGWVEPEWDGGEQLQRGGVIRRLGWAARRVFGREETGERTPSRELRGLLRDTGRVVAPAGPRPRRDRLAHTAAVRTLGPAGEPGRGRPEGARRDGARRRDDQRRPVDRLHTVRLARISAPRRLGVGLAPTSRVAARIQRFQDGGTVGIAARRPVRQGHRIDTKVDADVHVDVGPLRRLLRTLLNLKVGANARAKAALRGFAQAIEQIDDTTRAIFEDRLGVVQRAIRPLARRVRQRGGAPALRRLARRETRIEQGGVTRRERPRLRALRRRIAPLRRGVGRLRGFRDEAREIRGQLDAPPSFRDLQRQEGRIEGRIRQVRRGGVHGRGERVELRRLQAALGVVETEMGRRVGLIVANVEQQGQALERARNQLSRSLRVRGIDESSARGLTELAGFSRISAEVLKRQADQLEVARRRALRVGDATAVRDITERLTALRESISDATADWVEQSRAAVAAAAQERVDTGTFLHSLAGAQQEGFELDQRLAGTFDTGQSARAENIRTNVLPAIEKEMAGLRSQFLVAVMQGNSELARSIVLQLVQGSNDIKGLLADIKDASEQTAENTGERTGSLAFRVGGSQFNDLASLGVGK